MTDLSDHIWKLESLDTEEFRTELRDALRTAGDPDWNEVLGEGAYAVVHPHPDPGKVVKIFQDECFEGYIDAVDPDNPHFPQPLARWELSDGNQVWELERLRPLRARELESMGLSFLQLASLYYLLLVSDGTGPLYWTSAYEEIEEWLEEESERHRGPRLPQHSTLDILTIYLEGEQSRDPMARAVLELEEYRRESDCMWDIQGDNVMVAGDGRIVFSDPFSDYS